MISIKILKNEYLINILLIIRKLIIILFLNKKKFFPQKDKVINSPDMISNIISSYILKKKPFFVGRLGANEINIIENYFGTKQKKISLIKFLLKKNPEWFWHKGKMKLFKIGAGFFPLKTKYLEKYCVTTLKDLEQVDLHGFTPLTYSIYKKISHFYKFKKFGKCNQQYLEPYFSKKPWSSYLKGKKVLIIHPFSETICKQYKKREKLFLDKNVLPKFKLKTIKAIQSAANNKSKFKDWFEALDFMKKKIDKEDFDIAIIGCGAYGFNLGAYVKQKGKCAIHLAGATQILFGIKGKRYENLKHADGSYIKLFNKSWVRAKKSERPKQFLKIEGGTYW
jgi:hypothetical protein